MPRIEAHRRKFGQMETICVDGSKDGPTVILMHGYGADMTDLASLAGVIQAPKGVNWVFPNGHLRIPTSPHTEGRGWFPISISELEKTMAAGTGIDLSQIVPPGLKKSREAILHLIKELNVPLDRLVIGGFSQGGMLATDVAVHLPTPPRGLAVLSGTLVNADQWRTLAAKHAGFEFFQSHGRYDQVLSFAMAQRLETMLREAGWVGKLMPFEGGHEIPSEVLIQLGAYLRRRLG